MTGYVMRRLMAQHKGQFILIARIGNQLQRKCNNRTPRLVNSLERIRRLIRPVIDHNLEVAVHAGRARAAFAFGHRLHRADDLHKAACYLT